MAAAPNSCDASLLSQTFAGNLIVCSKTFRDYETQSGQAQIQSVVDSATKYYGPDSSTARVADAAATIQEAQVPADVSSTNDAVAASTVGQVFTTCGNGDAGIAIPGVPCLPFKWLALGAAALVVLYFLAIISSLVPRPR